MANRMFMQPSHFINLIIQHNNENIISTAVLHICLTFLCYPILLCVVLITLFLLFVLILIIWVSVLSRELCKNLLCFNYPLLIERDSVVYKAYYGQSF